MKFLTALIAAAGILAGTVYARDLEMVEGAYEVKLGNVTLPRSSAGNTLLRTCDSCDTVGLRVDGQTVFQVSGQPLLLADFLKAVDDIHDRAGGNESLVAVYYDLDTRVVTRINVVPSRR